MQTVSEEDPEHVEVQSPSDPTIKDVLKHDTAMGHFTYETLWQQAA